MGDTGIGRKSILVVGGGSLGGMLAHDLSRTANVVVCDTARSLVRQLQCQGLKVSADGQTRTVRVTAVSDVSALRGRFFDGIVFAVKCMDFERAIAATARHCRTPRVICWQNGDPSLRLVQKCFPAADIVRAVTTGACRADGRGHVRIFLRGVVYWGVAQGSRIAPSWWAKQLPHDVYAERRVSDWRSAVWAKLIFNAVMNPLPIIAGTGYDVLRSNDGLYKDVLAAIAEGKRVARAHTITLAFDPARIVRAIRCGVYGRMQHRGSMYDDFMAGKPLELEAITGILLARAKAAGVAMPVLGGIYAAAQERYARAGQ
ncbi:MAG: ketopantoate reductase family protein [Candidatus Omnitrophica bacterium]|nr:ketopantoate reductase family protein [Candidatus Omnitrophota bacterium]